MWQLKHSALYIANKLIGRTEYIFDTLSTEYTLPAFISCSKYIIICVQCPWEILDNDDSGVA